MVLLYLLVASSCTHSQESDGGEVIERSRASRPAWVSRSANEVRQGEQGYRYSFVKSPVLNLPLGISQAQGAAKQLAEQAYVELLRDSIVNRANSKGMALTTPASLTSLVVTAVSEFFPENIRVDDIYYERVRGRENGDANGSTFYRVHVIVSWPKVLDELTAERLKVLFAASDQQEIQGLVSLL